MKKQKDEVASPVELRRRAEGRLRERAERAAGRPASAADAKLVHELQVHQVELEMQNEELLRSRAELEASLERYSELYDFAPTGYFTLARDVAIRQVNLTGARMLGVPRSELVDRRFGLFVDAASLPAYNALLAKALRSEATESCDVTLLPSTKPTVDPIVVHLALSVARNGEECRAVAVDVTRRHKAEEQLRVWQTMEAVGRLAGGVAHDFNNLLTVMLTHAEFALKVVGDDAPLRSDLLDLKAAAERAAALTRQLLAFGRKQVLRPQMVDANALVFQLKSMLSRLLNPNATLELELASDLGPVEVDPAQFDRVIVNLVLNARDAMPGGGALTISTANLNVDEAHAEEYPMRKPGPFVVLKVKDTGTGMDMATVARIFEPFFTTKEKERGTGFGLSTVYGAVKQCGGEVSVESEPGKGSTFAIYLPRAPGSLKRPPTVATQTECHVDGAETILLVEDEEPVRKATSRVLGSAGYAVLVAASAAEALEVCQGHSGPIHLVLSDMVMPQMTGVELAARLKEVRPETKVLYMSGYAEEAVERVGALDAAVFIAKPFSSAALRQKVRELLDTRPD
ncbi:MAG TPA: ATP-binding protein [Polyangiaceae bacterium]|nr:ATP-binding protein [Polyangiaceae bacterium]